MTPFPCLTIRLASIAMQNLTPLGWPAAHTFLSLISTTWPQGWKKTRFKKKTSPVVFLVFGVFCFFCFFLYICPEEREVLGFFQFQEYF